MNVLIGVTGGISAYRVCDLILGLKQNKCDVRVIMTENAKQFITPMTISTLSKHPIMDNMWDEVKGNIDHIDIGKWADKFVVYPATANIIAKFANGIADDLLSTVYLALPQTPAPTPQDHFDGGDKYKVVKRIVFPAMNTNMLRHPATQRNISRIEGDGAIVTGTRETMLACGDYGYGALLNPRDAVEVILGGS